MRDPRESQSILFPTPARVAGLYLVLAAAWITGSDRLVEFLASNGNISEIQTYKGLFFISLTAVLIFLVLKIAHAAYRRAQASVEAASEEARHLNDNMRSLDRLRSGIFEMLLAQMALIDHKGQGRVVFRCWRDYVIGVSAAEHRFGVGQHVLDVTSPLQGAAEADRRLVAEGLDAILSGRSTFFCLEYPQTNKKGRTRWYELRIQGIEAGPDSAAVIAYVDVTDRKMREASLVLNDARFNCVAWNAPCGIVICRSESVLFSNPAARQLLGVGMDAPLEDALDGLRAQAQTGAARLRLIEHDIPWVDGRARVIFLTDKLHASNAPKLQVL